MKLTYNRAGCLLLLLVFSFLFYPHLSQAAVDEYFNIVENLKVENIPNDDGSGLMLSWKPLPKERRIIEYRVYRGISSDSLFYIGKIDVNVKTGVAGDIMYFYDVAYNYFVDIQSSGKLKREKQQPEDSPLFQRYPRDVNITGPRLQDYDILGVISEKDFYYKNRKITVETEEDTTVYAGLKVRNFLQLAKKLITDNEYYYTVLAVNEARKYYPHCEPVKGIPRENAPEKTKELYAVYVQDLNRLQFEWSLPTFTDDIYYHQIFMMKKVDLADFRAYNEELKLIEANNIAVKEDSTIAKIQPQLENPAELIYMRYSGYPYTPSKTQTIDIIDGRIISSKTYQNAVTGEEIDVDLEFDENNLDDYLFVFSLFDIAGYETFSDPAELEIINSDKLPVVPPFSVVDRENDKGDYNLVKWGKPIAFLTNSSYLNDAKTKLLVNYELNSNKDYKIKNVYFNVYDMAGNHLDYVNEYYQDKKIKINIPEDVYELNFEITFRCNKELPEDYILTQKLIYDEVSKSLYPNDIYLGNENLRNYEYYVYKRNYSSEEYRLSKKIPGTQRELDDNIRYTNSHFKLVKNYDADKQLFLVSPSFTLRLDEDRENSISTNLYPSEIEKNITSYKKNIAEYEASKDTLTDEVAIKNADDAIEYYQKRLEFITENPILHRAAEFKNSTNRLKFLDKYTHFAKNSFEYKIVKSDGKGHFTETPVYQRETRDPYFPKNIIFSNLEGFGIQYLTPHSNWFDMEMLPALITTFIFGLLVFALIKRARKGYDLYIRPIAGIQEIDNAIGRATEMGKPILFVPGLSGIQDVATLAGLSILGRVAKKAAEYDTRILVPVRDYLVLPIAQEIVKESHYEAGRPDSYDKNSVFFITTSQFAFVAGVNGIMIREKTATNFYMGMFWAEALLMTETGSSTGAIQISGTDAVTQIPFFITTCDYTLIGEELYAASAYLAREPLQMGTLKATDFLKALILIFIISGTILSTTHLTFLINAFPEK
ncbi:MAG: hypothetical protein APR54_07825 [Candidatus Cloacimonas sp. SDB]|nr:MAG: hypothetical protein APR54_07825 [Candidatus Cloacimonas sp. SDB]